MSYRHHTIHILVIFILSTATQAAVTLTQAIEEAQSRNPALRVLQSEIAIAEGGVTTAKTLANPEIAANAGNRRTVESGRGGNALLYSLEASQSFKFPGKQALEVALAQRNVELQKMGVSVLRFQLAAQVRRAFYQLLAARQVIILRNDQVKSADIFVESARSRVESGYASEFETLKSQTELIAAKKALGEARAKLTTSRVALNILMARDPSAPLEISGTMDKAGPRGSVLDFLPLALTRNPSLLVQQRQAEIAGLNLRSVKLSRRPDFSINAGLEHTDAEQSVTVGASIELPLWDKKQGAISTAAAQEQKALAEIARTRAEIAGEVAKAAAALQNARERLALYPPELLDKLKAFVAQAEAGFGQNTTTLLIYLDAKRTYFDTLSDYYDALANSAETRADLESAVGVPLELQP